HSPGFLAPFTRFARDRRSPVQGAFRSHLAHRRARRGRHRRGAGATLAPRVRLQKMIPRADRKAPRCPRRAARTTRTAVGPRSVGGREVARRDALASGAQHLPGVLVRDGTYRFPNRKPDAGGDPFVDLRPRLAAERFEEEEMAELVDELVLVPEVPVDGLELGEGAELREPRLFPHLPERGLEGGLRALHVALGKAPVPVRVADQQELRIVATAEYDAAGARLHARPLRAAPHVPLRPRLAAGLFLSHRAAAPQSGQCWWRRPSAGCPRPPRSAARGRDPDRAASGPLGRRRRTRTSAACAACTR